MSTDQAKATELERLCKRYLEAQLAGDRREAVRLVVEEGLDRGLSVQDVQLGVVQEAQREIGRLWQENAISIAEEHMATAISQVVLAYVYQRAQLVYPRRRKIVLACIEGELHDLPARLVADALELDGFEVKYLGANVPTDSLLTAIERERPHLVALSVTMSFHVSALREAVARIRAAAFGPVRIAIGGHACQWSPGLAEQLGVECFGHDAADVVRACRAALLAGAM